MTIASVLHVFDVVPALDETGKQTDPTVGMTTGLISYVEYYRQGSVNGKW